MRQQMPGVPGQVVEQLELDRRQMDDLSVDGDLSAVKGDRQRPTICPGRY